MINFVLKHLMKPLRIEFEISRGNRNFVNNIYVLHWIFFDGVPFKVNSLLRSSSDARADHTRDSITVMKLSFLHRYEEIKVAQTFFRKAMRRLHLLCFLPIRRCRSRRPVSVCVRFNTHDLA